MVTVYPSTADVTGGITVVATLLRDRETSGTTSELPGAVYRSSNSAGWPELSSQPLAVSVNRVDAAYPTDGVIENWPEAAAGATVNDAVAEADSPLSSEVAVT